MYDCSHLLIPPQMPQLLPSSDSLPDGSLVSQLMRKWKQLRQKFHKHLRAHLCHFLCPLLCYELTLMAASPLTENLLNRVVHSLILQFVSSQSLALSLFLNFIYLWLHWVFVAEQSFSTCCEWGLLFVVEL